MESETRLKKTIYYMATGENEPALVVEAAGRAFRLNSAYSPTNEAACWSEQYKKDDIKRVVCMFGIGTGLFAYELLKKISGDSKLVIFEPENELIEYIHENGKNGEPIEKQISERVSNILKDRRVTLCIGSEDALAFREWLFQNLDFYMVEGLIVAKHTMYDRLYEKEFLGFLHTINEVREQILVNKNTLARFREDAYKNVLTNMWIIEKMNPVSQLKEILPKEVPVIIVAAGPSLDKNIELLREAKGHCLIFAVDTAIPYLLKRDIIPDLTITVEPIKPVKHYLDPRSEEIPAVFDCESNPEIVGKHRSRVFVYNCRGYVKRLLEAVGKTIPDDVTGGGSVATAAFAILYELEMKHIIMIGQDLAYSGEATHAGGVESKGINNNIGYEMIEDIYGGQVRTRSDWLGYLRWFESAITVIRDMGKDITVTDATEGGAMIHGSEILTLKEALQKYCGADNPVNYNFADEISKLRPFLTEGEYRSFLEKTEEATVQMDEMMTRSQKAVEICDRLLTINCDKKENAEAEAELKEIRAFCEKCLIYPLINDYAVSEIAEEVSRLRLEAVEDDERRINEIKQQRLAFDAINRACGVVRKK